MVHVARMGELVQQQVLHDLGALERKAGIQADRAAGRAAAPTRALPAHHHAAITEARRLRERREARCEPRTGAYAHPRAQQRPHHVRPRRRAVQLEPPARALPGHEPCNEPRPPWSRNLPELPALTECGEIDAGGRERRGSRPIAQRALAPGFDPLAVARHELAHGPLRGTRRHHHLHPPAHVDAHGQATRAPAVAHGERRRRIARIEQRKLGLVRDVHVSAAAMISVDRLAWPRGAHPRSP